MRAALLVSAHRCVVAIDPLISQQAQRRAHLTLYSFSLLSGFSHSSGNTLRVLLEKAERRCGWTGAAAGSAGGQDACVAMIGSNCGDIPARDMRRKTASRRRATSY